MLKRVCLVEFLNLRSEILGILTLFPGNGELIWGSWRGKFVAMPNYALRRVGQRGQKVSRCGTIMFLEAEFCEVANCFINRTKVDLTAFIQ